MYFFECKGETFVHFVGKDGGKYVVNYDWVVIATVMSCKHMCLMGQGWFSTSKLHHEVFSSRLEIREYSHLATHELDYFVDTRLLKREHLGHIIIIIKFCQM